MAAAWCVGCTATSVVEAPPALDLSPKTPHSLQDVLQFLHEGYASHDTLYSTPTLTAWASDGVTPILSAAMSIEYDATANTLRWSTDDLQCVIAQGQLQSKGTREGDVWQSRPWSGTVIEGLEALLGSADQVPVELQLYAGPPSKAVLGRIVGGTVGRVIRVHRVQDTPQGIEVIRIDGQRGIGHITIDASTWRLQSAESLSRIVGERAIQMEPIRTTMVYTSVCPDQFDPPLTLPLDGQP
jgi:hypothetical protein